MNRDFNRVIIYGNLVKDPETKTFEDGSKVTSIVIAQTREWKDAQGTEHKKTSFIECRANKGRSDILSNNFKKGRPILIEGHLEQDRWEDKETNKKMSKLRVIIDDIRFTDPKSKWEDASKCDGIDADVEDSMGSFEDDDVFEEAMRAVSSSNEEKND